MAQQLLAFPDRIGKKLSEDPELNGYIHSQLRRYAPWIKSSGTPFFPGYTDHGADHLNRVLAHCEWLVADESWPLFTPMDAACITLSVLLHDAAMHLTADAFRALLSPESQPVRYPSLDQSTWTDLWRAYQLETKHWDAKRWTDVAGADYAARLKVQPGQACSIDTADLKESELPIVGEFIRRHHPRLAHEFATGRVGNLAFDAAEPPELLDLAGLVARSHGMQIRETFAYLETFFFGKVEVYNAHPVFLMALLRVADYLDLYAERAPNDLLAVKRVRSPFSSREWEAHQAIKELRYDSAADPERLDLIALPQSGFAHQGILNWVAGIQSELDQSWAILGEVFGRHARLRDLRVRLRRLATPLAEANFARTHNRPYRPPLGRLTLDADALLRLMIKPLYGDKPEIAVRELVQNAVDAVRTAGLFQAKHGIQAAWYPILQQMEADIVVSVCRRDPAVAEDVPTDWQYWLEVVDRGIGMTEEVIREYFLKVGASFRNSSWYSEQLTEEERSKLYRIGRFGIGVLAGFLCSESMRITTRHINAAEGYEYSCSLSSDGIEIAPAKTSPNGTRIRLQLTRSVHDQLLGNRFSRGPGAENSSLDWYALDAPRVAMISRRGAEITSIPPRYRIPPPELPSSWRTIAAGGGVTIQWSFEKQHPHCDLYVNGMFVETIHYQDFRSRAGRELKAPVVSILDPENASGLTITRDRLSGGIPFQEKLIRDLLLDHIAWIFVQAGIPARYMSPLGAPGWKHYDSESGGGDAVSEHSAYLVCKQGLIAMSQPNLRKAGVTKIACLNSGLEDKNIFREMLASGLGETPVLLGRFAVFGGFSEPRESVMRRYLLHPISIPFLGTKGWTLLLQRSSLQYVEPWIQPGMITPASVDFVRITGGGAAMEDPELEAIFTGFCRRKQPGGLIGLLTMEVQISDRADPVEALLSALWNELGLPPVISFEAAERRALTAGAARALVPYIARHYEVLVSAGVPASGKWWE